MWLDFQLWLSDAKHKLIFVISMAILVIASLLGGYELINRYETVKNRVETIQADQKHNDEYFDQLWFQSRLEPNTKNDVILTYDLYLKDPYISAYQLNTELKYFVNSVKDKYNITGNHVRAIGIRLYDRKIVWDKGLTPRAIAFYSVQQQIANQQLQKQEEKNKQQYKANQVKQINGQTANLNPSAQDSLPEQAWNYTTSNTGKINYNDYDLTVEGFQQYTKGASKPLTNQEFAFWLKLKLYQKLLGTNNIASAAILYLNYDLGGNVSYNNFVTISQDFDKFNQREVSLGDNTDYYPNAVLLKQDLAIYRPQLLYFALSGNMVKSRTEAQKDLIEMQPGVYNNVIQQHNKAAAKTTDKFGGQNYYKGDPFIATTGPYKRSYPKFERPAFSPVLTENNAFFKKDIAPGQ